MDDLAAIIHGAVTSWPGVTAHPHRFGGVEFQFDNHEIGHLHGSSLADLPFPVRVGKELVASGRASVHHVLPDSGWVSYYLQGSQDVPAVLELFRLNYDRLAGARTLQAEQIGSQMKNEG